MNSEKKKKCCCDEIPDITEIDIRKQLLVPHPANKDAYIQLKKHTPARIGVWRSGTRYNTETLLRFRADHAAAQDAVLHDVNENFLKEMGLFVVQSKCCSKEEYLTRPDLGKALSDEAITTVKEKCIIKPQIQIYVSDGLSSVAVEANLNNILPAIIQGLKVYNISAGTPFFVKYGRVRTVDDVSEVTGAEVVCNLIGERPGLVTAESMSAYIVYKAYKGMPEANMTVISNIHNQGLKPVEAGAYIADVMKVMLEKKASGVALKL